MLCPHCGQEMPEPKGFFRRGKTHNELVFNDTAFRMESMMVRILVALDEAYPEAVDVHVASGSSSNSSIPVYISRIRSLFRDLGLPFGIINSSGKPNCYRLHKAG